MSKRIAERVSAFRDMSPLKTLGARMKHTLTNHQYNKYLSLRLPASAVGIMCYISGMNISRLRKLPSNASVIIRKSQLPNAGYGLFARRNFRKGERITEYAGIRKYWESAKKDDGYNTYLLRVNRNVAVDARPTLQHPGRYANDAEGFSRVNGLHNNCEYLTYGNRCFIVSLRPIVRGEEILVGYSKAYWDLQRRIALANSR